MHGGLDSCDATTSWSSAGATATASSSNSSSSSISPSPTELFEWRLAGRIWLWVSPLLLIIGTSGNGLSFFVLRSCSFGKCSIAFTLSALAVVDTSVIFTTLLRQWILYLTDGFDVRTVLWSFGCKTHFFLTYYLCQLSSWTLVVVTSERALCVCLPLATRTSCTKSRVLASWIFVAVCLALINVHFLWTARYYADHQPEPGTTTSSSSSSNNISSGGGSSSSGSRISNETTTIDVYKCYIGHEYLAFFYDVWYWIDFTLLTGIPFVCIVTGNIVITICVFRAIRFRRRRWNSTALAPQSATTPSARFNSQPPVNLSSNRLTGYKPLTSSTAMLIGISMLFLFTTTPSALYFLLSDSLIESGTSDPQVIARIRLAFAITNLLYYANNSLNFLLYCLTGSRFRRAFIAHFRRQQHHDGRGQHHHQQRNRDVCAVYGTRSSN